MAVLALTAGPMAESSREVSSGKRTVTEVNDVRYAAELTLKCFPAIFVHCEGAFFNIGM